MPDRAEPELSPEFAKHDDDEQFLAWLNDLLAPHEEASYRDLPETYPTVHVLGVPRSGTTLLTQLIASHLDVAHVDHVAAALWRAPVAGLRLSRKLRRGRPFASDYQSRYGQTLSVWEPHEFGYFWTELLGAADMLQPEPRAEQGIDWERVRRVLVNMTHAVGRPLVFKAFLVAWHAAALQRALPRTCFVRIRRDPLDTALSLARLRLEYVASPDEWPGLKPREYSWLRDEPWWVQVAGQVVFVDRAITAQLDAIGGRQTVETTYEELCRAPADVLAAVAAALGEAGAAVAQRGAPPPLEPRAPGHPPPEAARLVESAVARFLEGAGAPGPGNEARR